MFIQCCATDRKILTYFIESKDIKGKKVKVLDYYWAPV